MMAVIRLSFSLLRPHHARVPRQRPAAPFADMLLLQRIYADVVPLCEYLTLAGSLPTEGGQTASFPVGAVVTRKRSVTSTWAGVPEFVVGGVTSAGGTHADIIQAAIGYLWSRPGSGYTTLLARGFERADDAPPLMGSVASWLGVKAVSINSAVDYLISSRSWRAVTATIGIRASLALLCDPAIAIFEPLENGCLLQIAGEPLASDVWGASATTLLNAGGAAAPHQSGVRGSGPPSHYLDAPNGGVIPVSRLLFSSTFGRGGPGLPASHALRILAPRRNTSDGTGAGTSDAPTDDTLAARRLLHHIFKAAPHMVYLAASAVARVNLTAEALGGIPDGDFAGKCVAVRGAVVPTDFGATPPASKRAGEMRASVPRGLTRAIPLFHDVIERHKNIQWMQLLEAHCPDSAVPRTVAAGASGGMGGASTVSALAGSKRAREEVPAADPSRDEAVKALATPILSVVSFVVAVLRELLPPPLLGGAHNTRSLFRSVSTVIMSATAGPNAAPRVRDMIVSIRTREFGVFHGGDPSMQTRYARVWTLWLLMAVVIPVVRAHFYVCAPDGGGASRPLFFRKPLWVRAVRAAWPQLTARLSLELLSTDRGLLEKQLRSRILGFARVRFVPKAHGLRPIMNLRVRHASWPLPPAATVRAPKLAKLATMPPTMPPSKLPSKPLSRHGSSLGAISKRNHAPPLDKSINERLSALHEILKFERRRQPEAAGAAVFGLDGAHAALRNFASVRRNRGPLYCFTADAQSAYDTLSQDDVVRRVGQMISEEGGYTVRSFFVVRKTAGGRISCRRERAAVALRGAGTFRAFAAACASRTRNAVFCDGDRKVESVAQADALKILDAHVRAHLVATPRGLALQGRGLPQGSCLSSALCNIAYGDIETYSLLPRARATLNLGSLGAADNGHERDGAVLGAALIMRLTDDWFVAAEREPVARSIADAVHAGAPSYGMQVKADKTKATFSFDAVAAAAAAAGAVAPNAVSGTGIISAQSLVGPATSGSPLPTSLRWAQLRICAQTGEPLASHSLYEGPGGIGAVVAGARGLCDGSPRGVISATLRAALRPKCHAVLLDGALVSLRTAARNVRELCVVAGAKVLVVIRRLRHSATGGPRGLRPDVIASEFVDAARYLRALVRTRCPGAAAPPVTAAAANGALVLGSAGLVDFVGVEHGESLRVDAAPGAKDARRNAACPLSDAEILWVALGAFARIASRTGGTAYAVRALLTKRKGFRFRVRSEVAHAVETGREDLASRLEIGG